MAVAKEKPEAKPDTALSPHRVAQMVEKARWARGAYSTYSRAEVLAIAKAVAEAAAAAARKYADWAVEETGFGNADHKEIKNRLCSTGLFEHYRDQNFTDFRIDAERKIVEIPKPAGVIFALTPSTNPVCSVFYKAILALLTRNAIVISPHPSAKACCADAARLIARGRGAGGRAGRHHPGDRRAVAADHRRGDEVRPHRPDPRDRRHADGARRLFVRQSGDRRRAGQQSGLCRRDGGRRARPRS